jgi:hypothetical protein
MTEPETPQSEEPEEGDITNVVLNTVEALEEIEAARVNSNGVQTSHGLLTGESAQRHAEHLRNSAQLATGLAVVQGLHFLDDSLINIKTVLEDLLETVREVNASLRPITDIFAAAAEDDGLEVPLHDETAVEEVPATP